MSLNEEEKDMLISQLIKERDDLLKEVRGLKKELKKK